MSKQKQKEKISLRTRYGKAIVKKIIKDRGYSGDLEKLKTYSNLDKEGRPKKIRFRTKGEEFNDIVTYYYKDSKIELITVSDYLDCITEDKSNQLLHPELAIKVEKKKHDYPEPKFIPKVGKIYVGSSYCLGNDCLIIITSKTRKQFKYEAVMHNYIPTEYEYGCGYTKTIEELIENGYMVGDLFGARNLKLSIDGHWADGNFFIKQVNEYNEEGLIERMSR